MRPMRAIPFGVDAQENETEEKKRDKEKFKLMRYRTALLPLLFIHFVNVAPFSLLAHFVFFCFIFPPRKTAFLYLNLRIYRKKGLAKVRG